LIVIDEKLPSRQIYCHPLSDLFKPMHTTVNIFVSKL
jgi:hypothetical protein